MSITDSSRAPTPAQGPSTTPLPTFPRRLHSSFIRYPQDRTTVRLRSVESTDPVRFGDFSALQSPLRDTYFESPVTTDDSSFMLQGGIAHVPLPLSVDAWGYDRPSTIAAKLELDHVRVFRPQDNYADMEPVFQ